MIAATSADSQVRLIILLYLFVGDATAGWFTGRMAVIDRWRWPAVVAGNALAAGLFWVGRRQAARRGKFLGFDPWLWMIATTLCYALGVVLNVFVGGFFGGR